MAQLIQNGDLLSGSSKDASSVYYTEFDGTHKSVQEKIGELNNNLDSLGKSVSDGKTLVANAITAKGVSTATDASFQTMADNILSINVSKLITVFTFGPIPTPSTKGSISTWISANCRASTSGTVAVAVYYSVELIASKSFNYGSPEAVNNTQSYYKDDSFNVNI